MPKKLETRAKKPKPAKKTSFDRIVYQLEESGAGTDFEAVCPELVIIGFGDNADEAKVSLRRLVADYLEDCEELGVLDETLIQAGFYFNGEVWMSNEVEAAPEPKIRFIGRPGSGPADEPSE